MNEFIDGLEDLTRNHSSTDSIDDIRIWIFNYTYNIQDRCDIVNPEDPIYDLLRANFSDINETFHDFYDTYSHWQEAKPLNRNHVS